MPEKFKYRAVALSGAVEKGTMSAESREQVFDYLAERSLIPITVVQSDNKKTFSFFGFFKGVDYENLILFTNSLATMIRAGVPLLRALRVIKIGPADGKFNQAIHQIRYSLESGKSLSESMSEFEKIFSKVYISSIAAGEESGQLESILDEMALILEQEMELNRQIKSGVRYPLLVIGTLAIAFIVLMGFVVPRFVEFYGAFNAALPLPTRIIIGLSNFITDFWFVLLALAGLAVAGFNKLVSKSRGKLWVDKQILKLPVLGQLIIKGNVARFSLMFRILFKAGLPIVKALEILSASVKNSQISREIDHLAVLMREGRDASITKKEFIYFPEASLQMMAIGLESGSLEKMLGELGNHYSKEVQYTSRHLTAILEPILTFVLGGFVLLLALAILLPMWNLIKVFQQ
jgi:MSHA biogenesis protein MshG